MPVSVNEAEVRRWLREAQPGQSIRYFQGFLASGTDASGQPLQGADRQAVARVADRLWRAAQHHLVHLVQRRQGPTNWAYIAIARPSVVQSGSSSRTEMHDE